ncbi:IS110 family transposase [Blastococcus sp. HT6-30]|uniref:IS110 family transposase n=1 Tax=Blastococcus sp. HT6-30 TaxID=3144843 RepID=UPI0032197BD7
MNGRQVRADEEPRFGGLDWSWERHAVCIVDSAGAVIERFEAEHQAAGLQTMTHRLRRAGVVRVAIERGDGSVVDALLAGGLEVVVVSSRQVKALRLRYGTAGNKDDRFDAFVLADVLRSDGHRLASLTPDSSATIGLRALVRARKDLIKHRIALANQLRANLLAAFPGAVGLFAEIDSPISLTFLTRFPCAERAAWLSEKRMAAWLAAVGYCGRQTAEQLMAHLRNAPAGLPGPAGAACATVTEQLVATLSDLRARIDVLDKAIAESLALHHDATVFTSLPRAGINRAALLLAEIGDCRARFPDDTALAAAAGVAPSTRASGKRHHVAFRHSCDKKLREALIDFAADSRQASPWAADIYQRARDRGARHPHAVRILARAWCRIIWRCWTDNTAYDPARYNGLQQLLTAAG